MIKVHEQRISDILRQSIEADELHYIWHISSGSLTSSNQGLRRKDECKCTTQLNKYSNLSVLKVDMESVFQFYRSIYSKVNLTYIIIFMSSTGCL
jgi:hypothetical protein